jgi:Na+/melibiose symporter-like transporter
MDPAAAGAAIFAGKVSDLFSYPSVGLVADRVRSPWGPRKPLLTLGAVLGVTAFLGLFAGDAPESDSARFLVAALALLALSLALATYNVPYVAMAADLCSSPAERTRLMSYRATFYMFGTFVGGPIATHLVGSFGSGAAGFRGMAWILGPVIAASLLLPLLAPRAAVLSVPAPPSPLASLRNAFDNQAFNALMVVKVLQFLGFAGTQSTLLFFITFVLHKDPGYLAWYGGSIILAALPTIPLWRRVADRWSRAGGFLVATYVYGLSVASFLWADPQESLTVFCLRAAVAGVGSAGMLVCGQVMLLDTMAHDRTASGRSREGLMSALYTFTEKLAAAVGPLLVALLLSVLGFRKELPPDVPQSGGAYLAIELGLVWLTVATTLLIHVAVGRYRSATAALRPAAVPR